MAITYLGVKSLQGTKADRVVDSLGSSADGINSGVTLFDNYVRCKVYNSSGVEQTEFTSAKLRSDIGTDAFENVTMTGSHTVAEGDRIVMETNGGDSSNKILFLRNNSNGNDNPSNTQYVRYESGSFSNQTKSITGSMIFNGSTVNLSSSTDEAGSYPTSNEKFGLQIDASASQIGQTLTSVTFKLKRVGDNPAKLGSGAYSFDGSNDYVQTSTKFNYLHDGTGGSIAFWVKPRNLASVHNNGDLIFDSMATSAGSGTGIQIRFKTDKGMRFNFTNSSNGWFTNVNSTTTFADDTWYHVAMTFGSSTVKVYVNGTLEDTETFSNPNTNASGGNFTIGRHATDPSSYGYFDGVLDDIGIYKRVLTATEISDLVNKTGDVDGLGSSADGTVTGATLDTTNEKLGSGCFSFDGSGDQVIFGSASDWSFLNSGEDFSLVFWLRPSATNATQALFSTMSDASGSNKGFSVSMTSSNQINLAVYPSAGGGYPFANDVGTSVFDANQWNHYALVYTKSDGNMRVYKNGSVIITQAKNGTFTAGTPSYAMMFGQRGDGGDRDYNGQVDDSAVFERALSSTEVSNLYNSGTGALVSTISTTGLKAYWNFDQNPPTNQASPTINGALVSSLTDKSELKAYYSMDSTSLSLPTATVNEQFADNTGWTLNSASISNNSITVTGSTESYKSITGLGKPNKLTWDLTFTRNSGDAGDSPSVLLSSQNSGYGDPSSGHTNVQFYLANGNATWLSVRKNNGSGNVQTQCNFGIGSSSVNIQPTGTTRYYRITKNGSVWTMKKFTSASDRTNDTNAEASATTTQTSTADSTWDSGSGNLIYLVLDGHASGTKNYTVSDVKVYEGVTEGCANDFSSTSDLEAMTNLPTNTIFLQTDDTPSYWWKQSDNTWKVDAISAIAFWSTAATSAIFAKGATYSGNYAKQSSTMEWNGSAWSSGANTNTAAYFCGGIGNKTGGMVMGGTTADAGANSASNVSEKYDGSSWSATGTLNSSTSGSPFGGISSSAFGATIWGGGGASPATTSQSWNNTSWSSSTNCATASRFPAGDGSSNTNFFLVGGNDSNTNRAEIWNGTSWSAGVSFSGSGTLAAGRGSGGAGYGSTNFIALSTDGTNHVYTFDGTSWTLASGTASDKDSAGIGGDKNKAITASGWSSGSFTNGSESWNGTSWSTNGNLTASIGSGGMGASA